MYKGCLQVFNSIDKINIEEVLESVHADIDIKLCKDRREIKPKGYLLYIGNDLNFISSLNSDIVVFTVWYGESSDYVVAIPNLLGLLEENASSKIVTFAISKCIEFISSMSFQWLYKYLLDTIINLSPDMIWFKDQEERHVILNREFGNITGKDPDWCINKKHPDIWGIPWEEYESSDFACRKSEKEIIKTRKPAKFEEAVLTGGSLKQFVTYKAPLFDEFGGLLGTCGIGHNCTEFNNIGLELDIILSSMPFPIMLFDDNFNIIRMNDSAESFVNGTDTKFDYVTWKYVYLHHVENNIYQMTMSLAPKYVELIEQPIKDLLGNTVGYFSILQDVTYRRLYEQELYKSANYDALTSIFNRRHFYETLQNLIGSEVTLVYIDLDFFKAVNDKYGHNVGDSVLICLAKSMCDVFGEDACYRLGGDEFAVVIPSDNSVEDKVKILIEEFDKTITNLSPKCCISYGISSTDCLHDIDLFIQDADKKMYEDKVANKRLR